MVSPLRGPDALERLGPALDCLLDAAGTPLTARRPWLQTWVNAVRDSEPWCIPVEGPGGRLEACALLARRVRAGVLDITALGHGSVDYSFLPARDDDAATRLAAAAAEALGSVRRPWRLRVEQLPRHDPVAHALARRMPLATIEPGDASPVIVLDPAGGLDAHMSVRMRRNLRTTDNRLQREGLSLHYVHETSRAGIGAFLPEVERVWRDRERAVGRPNQPDRRTIAFFLAAIDRFAPRGQVELTVLLLGGSVAAFALCLVDGPAVRVWVPRIDPRFKVYGPGHLVTRAILARALEQGRTEVDWMRGEEPYKLQTATTAREHEHLVAWSSPAARTAIEGLRTLRTRALRARATP
jgi:CelD/BcsL family acetyltransferase involved in cellulose biosynthesis